MEMTQPSRDMNCTVPSNFLIPVSGYMRVVRRRTLTKWTNLHLNTASLSIEDICDLVDSVLAAKLVTLLSGNRIAVSIFEPQRKKRQEVGWKNVCSYLASQDFPAECTGKNNETVSSCILFCITDISLVQEHSRSDTVVQSWQFHSFLTLLCPMILQDIILFDSSPIYDFYLSLREF